MTQTKLARMVKGKPMTLDYFNDFYTLEAIRAQIVSTISDDPRMEFSHSLTKLREDVDEYYKDFVAILAKRTMLYLWAACLGEARHASGEVASEKYLENIERNERHVVFENAPRFPPNKQNMQVIRDIFSQKWAGSFGGKAWLRIFEAVEMYFTTTPATFIDHAVDLEHNTGTVFNKTSGKLIGFTISYEGSFTSFLYNKFNYNIITRYVDEFVVARKTKNLVNRLCTITRKPMPYWIIGKNDTLDDLEILWGNDTLKTEKKWTQWADCVHGNRPNVESAYALTSGARLWNSKTTISRLQKTLAKAQRKMLSTLSPHGDYSSEVALYIANKFEQLKHYCKIDKQPVLYEALPVTLTHKHGGTFGYNSTYTAHIPYPHFGYGQPDGRGFNVDIRTYHKLFNHSHTNNAVLMANITKGALLLGGKTIDCKPLEAILE